MSEDVGTERILASCLRCCPLSILAFHLDRSNLTDLLSDNHGQTKVKVESKMAKMEMITKI